MENLKKSLETIFGKEEGEKKKMKIKGIVKLMKKNVHDANDSVVSFIDDQLHELFGNGVSIQLISASHSQSSNNSRGRLGEAAMLENWEAKITAATSGEVTFDILFEWEESMGVPGAFIIKSHHHSHFYLKTLTLEDIPNHGKVNFVCNSWIYPLRYYNYDRVFFSSKTYLPSNTPETLREYREEELKIHRGNGASSMPKEWDRVYDYDYYNDLGNPENDPEDVRPVLGGSLEYPYPRRCRTGRPRSRKDPNTESRLPLPNVDIYVPRDERITDLKFSDFFNASAKSLTKVLLPEIKALFDKTPKEFSSFEDVIKACEDELLGDGETANKSAWRTDDEFGREMLTGVNPNVICRLKDFPPASKLDSNIYGNQTSSMTREQLEKNMNGLSINEAIEKNKLFILDHHDTLMPYLRRVNATDSKIYASRTVLFLRQDGTLKPLAIELSLPHPLGDTHGATSHIYTPVEDGIDSSIWQLAKAYVAVTDSGYHQLITHWLSTHAVIEPFVIATNRQLSVVHPIYKLLCPHFRDTMNMNALARQLFINANGVNEKTIFPAKYSMEFTSFMYKSWVFTDQALPADLLKRGMAIADSSEPQGIRLLIEDYPYAVDGLDIWLAIKSWVSEYCSIYYPKDDTVKDDHELQSWWIEIQVEGHGDKKNEPWWPKMETLDELIHILTIIIWVASALHASVSYGQYPYDSTLPNRPTASHRLMPELGSTEYSELESEPEKAFLKTFTSQVQTLLGTTLVITVSRHPTDEIYLGQRENPDWTSDVAALDAFERFRENMVRIEKRIVDRNKDKRLKNRHGPGDVPNTSDDTKEGGFIGKGIPNSISI